MTGPDYYILCIGAFIQLFIPMRLQAATGNGNSKLLGIGGKVEFSELNDEQKILFKKMDEALDTGGGSIEHDLSDPEQLEYVKLFQTICGNDATRFPKPHEQTNPVENRLG